MWWSYLGLGVRVTGRRVPALLLQEGQTLVEVLDALGDDALGEVRRRVLPGLPQLVGHPLDVGVAGWDVLAILAQADIQHLMQTALVVHDGDVHTLIAVDVDDGGVDGLVVDHAESWDDQAVETEPNLSADCGTNHYNSFLWW